MLIKEKYIVEKRNILNEFHSQGLTMSLQELRFFSIYLAKINSRDDSTRVVRFPMEDFKRIMGMNQLNITQLRHTTNSLLSKILNISNERGGYDAFHMFKKCRVDKNENGEWYVEIDAHDDALPLMFNFKDKYFTYELWNALQLKSANQLRMYEILKQYENIGERTVKVDDLKELLGMQKTDYPRYDSLRADVIDVCQSALETYTDIKFTYEPIKKGRGGKINSIKFIISKNENHVDPLSLADFIDIDKAKANEDDVDLEINFKNDRMEFLAGACSDEFNESEIQVLYNLIVQIITHEIGDNIGDYQIKVFEYLKHRYDELNWRANQREIKNRFGYLKKLLEADILEKQETDI